MDRRRLYTYVASLAVGIFGGYQYLEEQRRVVGIGLMLLILMVLFFIHYTFRESYHFSNHQRDMMIIWMMLGFLIFGVQYHRLSLDESKRDADDSGTIFGRVVRVQSNDDRTSYVIEASLPSGSRRILCNEYDDSEVPKIGEIISVNGSLKIPDTRRNPRCFNYRLYLKTQRISYIITVKNRTSEGLSSRFRDRYRRYLRQARDDFITLYKDDEIGAFLEGTVFGDKSSMDDEMYEEFTGNGTAHILAVSGLHVGFLISIMTLLARKKKHKRIAMIMTFVLMVYGEMTEWSPSTTRAVIIAILAMCSMYIQRQFDLTSALAFSAGVMLVQNPYQLFHTGFLMSYLAVFGMAILQPVLAHFVDPTFAAMLSLQLMLMPYTISSFNRWNPLTILINIPIVLMASILVPLAVIQYILVIGNALWLSLSAGIMGEVVRLLSIPIESLIRLLVGLNHRLYMDGAFLFQMESLSMVGILGCYAMFFYLGSELFRVMVLRKDWDGIRKLSLVILLPVLICGVALENSFLDDEVVFIDVGQGDAVHIRADRKNVLIDGGGSRNYSVGEKVLLPYLLKNGATKLDLALCTHLHMDHYEGVRELSEDYPIEKFGVPSVYQNSEKVSPEAKFLHAGMTIDLSEDVTITVLWPLENSEIRAEDEEDENMCNGVYRIDYRGTRILVAGDLLEEGESDMLQYYANTDELRADVLKVAHHGSRSSSSDAFLDAVQPRIAVIQVGENNNYGHPSEETLEKLSERNVRIYRTDRDGAIGLDIHRNSIEVDRMIE